jgi:hypothetical protein
MLIEAAAEDETAKCTYLLSVTHKYFRDKIHVFLSYNKQDLVKAMVIYTKYA